MAKESVARCVWLVDTIRRYGRITRSELNKCWLRSPFSDGKPLSRRTFYHHRDDIEELFNLRIECDLSTYEYYIDEDSGRSDSVANWLLDSMCLNDVLSDSRDISDRIFVENVPSSREFLSIFIDALKQHHPVRYDYHPYTRTLPTRGVVLEPYFLKLFKQRWYVVGRNVAEDMLKTYALDRILNAAMLTETFEADPLFEPADYFRDAYGIVVDRGEPRKVVLRVEPRQAKYFAALPLHHSQIQTVADNFSLFTYRLCITDDFIQELLSYGPRITVLEPPELRARIRQELTDAIATYDTKPYPLIKADEKK